LADGESEITEADWLSVYGRTIQVAQEFEDQLLGLFLTVRYFRDAEKADEEFRKVLNDRVTAGGLFARIRADRELINSVVLETFADEDLVEQIPKALEVAIEVRNLLAHYYFRIRSFESARARLLVVELEGLQTLLWAGKTIAGELKIQLSKRNTTETNSANDVLLTQIEHFGTKHLRTHELAKEGARGLLLLNSRRNP